MTQPATLVSAAVVGAIAGAVAGALVMLSPFGPGGPATIPVTIVLRQAPGAPCDVKTEPFRAPPARRADVIRWTVAGRCDGINPDNVEIQFVGVCGELSKSVTDPDLFDEPPPHRGRRIVRTVKSNQDACYRYQVVHGSTVLEDPELEIMQ